MFPFRAVGCRDVGPRDRKGWSILISLPEVRAVSCRGRCHHLPTTGGIGFIAAEHAGFPAHRIAPRGPPARVTGSGQTGWKSGHGAMPDNARRAGRQSGAGSGAIWHCAAALTRPWLSTSSRSGATSSTPGSCPARRCDADPILQYFIQAPHFRRHPQPSNNKRIDVRM